MKWMMLCCTFALWLAQAGLARAVSYNLGDIRLAPIDDPYSIRFQGGSTETTKEKIAQAIRFIGASRGWKVASEAEDRMELTILVRGQHEVAVEVEYDASAYSVRYVRSANLLYREEIRPGVRLRVIHRNYNSWISGLVTAVNKSIAAPAQVAVGFAPIGDADAVPFLREKAREAYRQFLAAPMPRAFAIAPNGFGGWDSQRSLGARNDVVENALTVCKRRSNEECKLYAIDDRVVWTMTNAPAQSTASAARALSGDDLVRHAGRFSGVQFNPNARNPFTLSVSADGKAERICETCPVPAGAGTMTVKPGDGLVCFQWEKVSYPDSGCFQVLPAGANAFEMRGTNGEGSIRYSLKP